MDSCSVATLLVMMIISPLLCFRSLSSITCAATHPCDPPAERRKQPATSGSAQPLVTMTACTARARRLTFEDSARTPLLCYNLSDASANRTQEYKSIGLMAGHISEVSRLVIRYVCACFVPPPFGLLGKVRFHCADKAGRQFLKVPLQLQAYAE